MESIKYFYLALLYVGLLYPQEDSLKVASQNPSPMVEYTRTHERIIKTDFAGLSFTIDNFLINPIELFIPKKSLNSDILDLLIHFHGAGFVVKNAVEYQNTDIISVAVNIGSGSKVYFEAFKNKEVFNKLIDSIQMNCSQMLKREINIKRIHLSGFSAGYGAIKSILSFPEYFDIVSSVILLDGLHTSYIPDKKVLFEGGKIDSSALDIFMKLAAYSAENKSPAKKFLITHSEIFPGTFASTTETTDYLIHALAFKRQPVLKWGPLGMQQFSEVKKNNLTVLGYAGNSAPDHVDHLHALFYFFKKILEEI